LGGSYDSIDARALSDVRVMLAKIERRLGGACPFLTMALHNNP
jgi:hypothetical protein